MDISTLKNILFFSVFTVINFSCNDQVTETAVQAIRMSKPLQLKQKILTP